MVECLSEYISDTPYYKIQELVKPLNIHVKDYGNLYMLNFDDSSDFTNKIVRQASGCIIEKNTNKIVHYSFDKCYDSVDDKYTGVIDEQKVKINMYFDGSLIKLYYYDNKWNMSTSSHFDASKNSWASKKSFLELFIEALPYSYNINDYDTFLNTLDKNCCYTYLLQHPENAVYNKNSIPVVFIINKLNLSSMHEERPCEDDLIIHKKISELDDKHNYMIYLYNDDGSITRIKKLSNTHLYVKNLLNNYPDLGLTYLSYSDNVEQRDKLVKYFPNKSKYNYIDNSISKICKFIYNLYYQNYINKSNINIPKKYKTFVTQLHRENESNKTFKINDVYSKLYSLNPRVIARLINYKY